MQHTLALAVFGGVVGAALGAVHLDMLIPPPAPEEIATVVPNWEYVSENVRLQPPVTGLNNKLAVPKGLCDTVESVSGVCC